MFIIAVAPLAGAWIEIVRSGNSTNCVKSLLSRERGLKLLFLLSECLPALVAPLAGAWIEIVCVPVRHAATPVAPLAGAWIEIEDLRLRQLPAPVAPLAGAWIEIRLS